MQLADQFPVSMVRDRESNVSFRVGGVIQALNVRAGQMVQSGQSIATLKPTLYTSNRARAETNVNKLQNAARRNGELLKAGAVSTGTKEDTEDALAAAKAALDAAQYDEESTTIKAPFNGIVLSRDAELGETVSPGQRVVRIADVGSALMAKASVPTQAARKLRIGESAKVRVGDASLVATIRHIGALSDPRTGSVTVDLVVQQASTIASGTLGSVEFIHKTESKSSEDILLPPEALLESTGGVGSVFVLDSTNSTARRTPIKVLGFDGEMIRIAGLDKGVKVLTTGAGFVSDGQKVQEIRQ
jgi:RND family efflux transporter MFP subunit